jgi:hypothetical protein
MGVPPPNENSSNGAKDGHSSSDSEFVGRIASDHMYQGAPILETVTVRAFAIESIIVIICGLVLIDSGTAVLYWFSEQIAAFPVLSGWVAALCFVFGLFVGAIRQLFGNLLSHAGALPVVDDRGRPKFSYIGNVPPYIWQYSPWCRAATWILVAAPSLVSALIGSFAANQLFGTAYVPGFLVILALRWLISSIPKRLIRNEIQE